LSCTRQTAEFRYDAPPAGVVEFVSALFWARAGGIGPARSGGTGCPAADLESVWAEANEASDGTTLVPNEYLEVHAVRS
jgi:hypothetical protein